MARKVAHWHRSLRLVGGIWLFTLALFLLQLALPDSAGREPVQVVLFLVLILLALPKYAAAPGRLAARAALGPGRHSGRLSAIYRRRRRYRCPH